MITLHLIRHAKTHQQSTDGTDYGRALMEKGIAQANVLGHYFHAHHIDLGHVISSSAKRTQQTTSIVYQQMAEHFTLEYSQDLYLSSEREYLDVLKNRTEAVITLVGHNDGISELASYLADEEVRLRTSEYICLTFSFDNWNLLSRGTGFISLRYRPDVFLPMNL